MLEKSIKPLDFAFALWYIVYVSNGGVSLKSKGGRMTLTKDGWNYQFAEIENWLGSKGYEVVQETDADDSIVWDSKTVYINSRNHPETRYYTLLHECGHLLVSQGAKQWAKDIPMYASSEDARVERSKAYGVSLVAEEIEAWKRGRRLGNRFNHYINNEKYDSTFTQCVFSYIESVAEGC